jgi:hypothetical protein
MTSSFNSLEFLGHLTPNFGKISPQTGLTRCFDKTAGPAASPSLNDEQSIGSSSSSSEKRTPRSKRTNNLNLDP